MIDYEYSWIIVRVESVKKTLISQIKINFTFKIWNRINLGTIAPMPVLSVLVLV